MITISQIPLPPKRVIKVEDTHKNTKFKRKSLCYTLEGRGEDHKVTWTDRLADPVLQIWSEEKQGRLCCLGLTMQKKNRPFSNDKAVIKKRKQPLRT